MIRQQSVRSKTETSHKASDQSCFILLIQASAERRAFRLPPLEINCEVLDVPLVVLDRIRSGGGGARVVFLTVRSEGAHGVVEVEWRWRWRGEDGGLAW